MIAARIKNYPLERFKFDDLLLVAEVLSIFGYRKIMQEIRILCILEKRYDCYNPLKMNNE